MKYKSYLFDFDGTLVDSMPSFISVMLRILDENMIPYESDIIKIITPLGYKGTAAYYRNTLGLALPEDEILARMNGYIYREYAENIPAKKHVADALRALRAAGADLHILTASPHAVLDVCLARLGLTDLFDNVWSCDDFGTTKANPDIYRQAAARIGRSVGEVLFLDDNCLAVKTAAAAGMRTCGVYDPSSEDYRAEMRAIADHYIEDFSALFGLGE